MFAPVVTRLVEPLAAVRLAAAVVELRLAALVALAIGRRTAAATLEAGTAALLAIAIAGFAVGAAEVALRTLGTLGRGRSTSRGRGGGLGSARLAAVVTLTVVARIVGATAGR